MWCQVTCNTKKQARIDSTIVDPRPVKFTANCVNRHKNNQ
jgi:hypothetical protein